MATSNETVLLKSTLEINNKAYSVKLTSSEIYWETITSARASGGPYSEPLVPDDHEGLPQGLHRTPTKGSPSSDPYGLDVGQSRPTSNYHHYERQDSDVPLLSPQYDAEEASAPSVGVDVISYFPEKTSFLAMCCAGSCSSCCCKTENQTVKIVEILAVRLDAKSTGSDGKFQHVEMVALQSTAFVIYVIRRLSKHRWRHRAITFHSRDSSVIQQWVDKIGEIINKPEFRRPKHLLVFVNPFGGKKRGPKIYHDKIAPLFDMAGITTDVIVTQRPNHARDTLMEYDLSKVDGVVCVGGDGMFSELMHGILTRSSREAGIEQVRPGDRPVSSPLRIGIIPAGSTDTVAWTMHGTKDPVTSALHIILGDNISLDVATVHHEQQFLRYNISLFGYGYYGDCMVDSEQNRWMGPARYSWSGFKKVLGNRAYEGELSYLPNTDRESHPRDGVRCRAGCQVCGSVQQNDTVNTQQGTPAKEEDIAINTDAWQKIKGRFIAINAFVIACRCSFSPDGPAPSCHLGDGCTDLVVINECSRADYAKHLLRCMDKTADQYDFPFIQTFRVREFKFRPLMEESLDDTHEATDSKQDGQQRLRSKMMRNSVWNCDGEILNEASVDVRVFAQVINLFGRGIEEEVAEEPTACVSCTCGNRA